MKILVTGPDGVLGNALVRELLTRNYTVSVLLEPGKNPLTLEDLPITKLFGNVLDIDAVNSAIEGNDIIFHCAASTSVFPARNEIVNRVNIDGTQNIVNACLTHNVNRLIYVGTANSFGFGTSLDNLGKEGNPYLSARFGIDYIDSKYKAQLLVLKAVKEQGLPAIVVNPTYMIGENDSRPSSGAMILALYQNKVPAYTLGGKNYVAVKDVATAMANAITMGRIGECYILGNENLTYQEAFNKITKVCGLKQVKRKMPTPLVKLYGSLNSYFAKTFNYYPALTKELAVISCEKQYYSPEKARKELLLPQTPIHIAAKECFDWFEANGYLTKK